VIKKQSGNLIRQPVYFPQRGKGIWGMEERHRRFSLWSVDFEGSRWNRPGGLFEHAFLQTCKLTK